MALKTKRIFLIAIIADLRENSFSFQSWKTECNMKKTWEKSENGTEDQKGYRGCNALSET